MRIEDVVILGALKSSRYAKTLSTVGSLAARFEPERELKLLFLTSGPQVPSTRFRVLQFLPQLRSLGHTCVVAHSRPAKYTHWPWLGWRGSVRCREWLRWIDLLRARWGRFDVVFLERELFDAPDSEWEAAFRQVARRFVLDVDDGIFLKYPEKFARVSGFADTVIAGNELLATEARRFAREVVVVPTVIDLDRYPFEATRDPTSPVVIGWTGTRSNLAYLEVLRKPLERLAQRHTFEWHVVTNAEGLSEVPQFQGVTTRSIPWSEESEIAALGRFDIGVMPLPDDPWARYKCGFKLIQYMAVGAAGVASPVGVNAEIADQGRAARWATNSEEWESQLDRLLASAAERQQIRELARQRVATHYSLQALFPTWYRAVLGAHSLGREPPG